MHRDTDIENRLVEIAWEGEGGISWEGSIEAYTFSSVQFSSVARSCLTLCSPMNHSTPGLPVHHQLSEFTQTQVHWVGDAIQPSCVKQIISGNLLYDAGSSTQCSVTSWRGGMGWGVGGRFKREGTYVYRWLIHVVLWQKPTQIVKQLSSN